LKGNLGNMYNQLGQFANLVKKNMETIGNSISTNLIDKINETKNTLSSINGQSYSNYSKSVKNNLKDPVMWNGSEMKQGQVGRIKVTKAINLWKRNGDKLEFARILKPGESYRVYGYDEK